MNWEAIGALGEVVGGVIVIATVIYLSKQIRESNRQARAQTEREMNSKWHEIINKGYFDPALRAINRKGCSSFSALTEDEKTVYAIYIVNVMDHVEVTLRMEQQGLLAKDWVDDIATVALAIFTTPGFREFWDLGFRGFGNLAVRFVEENLHQSDIVPLNEALPFFSAEAESHV